MKMSRKTGKVIMLAMVGILICMSGAGAATPIPIDRWTVIAADQIMVPPQTGSYPAIFGIWAADVNGDRYLDICSGGYFYINPGASGSGKMTGTWTKIILPYAYDKPIDACLMYDWDGDGTPEIIAMAYPDIYYYYTTNKGVTWTAKPIGYIPRIGHGNAQGQCLADLEPSVGGADNKGPEVVLLSENGATPPGSIYYFVAPSNPRTFTGFWIKDTVNNLTVSPAQTVGEDVSAGDINGDGWIDLVTVNENRSQLKWWENPKTRKKYWQQHIVGNFNGQNIGDRVKTADLDGDGKLDIIVAESSFSNEERGIRWFKNPGYTGVTGEITWGDGKGTLVPGSTVGGYGNYSLWPGDIDRDGDIDFTSGQTLTDGQIKIWQNNGAGNFSKAYSNGSTYYGNSHNSAKLFDMDSDGDLDIISIPFTNGTNQYLTVFRNDGDTLNKPLSTAIAPQSFSNKQNVKMLPSNFAQWSNEQKLRAKLFSIKGEKIALVNALNSRNHGVYIVKLSGDNIETKTLLQR